MKKLFAFIIILAVFAGISFAANPAPAGNTVEEVPLTVIVVDDGDPSGSVDAGLNSGLERFLGAKLKVNVVTRSAAMSNPEYQGLNLDFMPIYLFEPTEKTKSKFDELIRARQAREFRNGKVIFMVRNGVFANKEIRPRELDLYVMSQCPYGVAAENKIIDLMKLERIPKDIKINVRFIVSEFNGEINSLHGPAEWEEDVRQIIIREKFPQKFWKYLEIRNKNYRSSLWDRAAEEAGINPKVFAKYWDFGVQKLKEDIKYTEEYNISGSPSLIWQGRVSTDMGSIGSIKGLEGFQQSYGGGNAGGAPQGRC